MSYRDARASIGTAAGDARRPTPGTVAADDFRAAFRNHPAGVAIVTADDGGGPAGLTATSVTPVSAEPALLLFTLSSGASAAPVISNAETAVVHLVCAEQVELARRFATSGIDRFAGPVGWTRLATGEPLLGGVDTWLRGRIVDRIAAGDSTVVLLRVVGVHAGRFPRSPLVYLNRTWYSLGAAAVLPGQGTQDPGSRAGGECA